MGDEEERRLIEILAENVMHDAHATATAKLIALTAKRQLAFGSAQLDLAKKVEILWQEYVRHNPMQDPPTEL